MRDLPASWSGVELKTPIIIVCIDEQGENRYPDRVIHAWATEPVKIGDKVADTGVKEFSSIVWGVDVNDIPAGLIECEPITFMVTETNIKRSRLYNRGVSVYLYYREVWTGTGIPEPTEDDLLLVFRGRVTEVEEVYGQGWWKITAEQTLMIRFRDKALMDKDDPALYDFLQPAEGGGLADDAVFPITYGLLYKGAAGTLCCGGKARFFRNKCLHDTTWYETEEPWIDWDTYNTYYDATLVYLDAPNVIVGGEADKASTIGATINMIAHCKNYKVKWGYDADYETVFNRGTCNHWFDLPWTWPFGYLAQYIQYDFQEDDMEPLTEVQNRPDGPFTIRGHYLPIVGLEVIRLEPVYESVIHRPEGSLLEDPHGFIYDGSLWGNRDAELLLDADLATSHCNEGSKGSGTFNHCLGLYTKLKEWKPGWVLRVHVVSEYTRFSIWYPTETSAVTYHWLQMRTYWRHHTHYECTDPSEPHHWINALIVSCAENERHRVWWGEVDEYWLTPQKITGNETIYGCGFHDVARDVKLSNTDQISDWHSQQQFELYTPPLTKDLTQKYLYVAHTENARDQATTYHIRIYEVDFSIYKPTPQGFLEPIGNNVGWIFGRLNAVTKHPTKPLAKQCGDVTADITRYAETLDEILCHYARNDLGIFVTTDYFISDAGVPAKDCDARIDLDTINEWKNQLSDKRLAGQVTEQCTKGDVVRDIAIATRSIIGTTPYGDFQAHIMNAIKEDTANPKYKVISPSSIEALKVETIPLRYYKFAFQSREYDGAERYNKVSPLISDWLPADIPEDDWTERCQRAYDWGAKQEFRLELPWWQRFYCVDDTELNKHIHAQPMYFKWLTRPRRKFTIELPLSDALGIEVGDLIAIQDETVRLALRFEEGWGKWTGDYSRMGNNGRLYGGYEWVDEGLRLNGSDAYVDASNRGTKITDALTIAIKVKVLEQNRSQWLIHRGDNDDSGYHLYLYSDGTVNKFFARIWGDKGTATANVDATLNEDKWLILAYKAGEGGSFYVDDELVGSIDDVGNIVYPTDSNVNIGRLGTDDTHYLNGIVEEAYIWNYKFTDAQRIVQGNPLLMTFLRGRVINVVLDFNRDKAKITVLEMFEDEAL
ncbi:MAG: hypothetical protein DRJ03_06240 [Chloroflexi bacterium]|nr:MAG: hypothetical protein DRJ03_06240 [Chloroflexota bacterium]